MNMQILDNLSAADLMASAARGDQSAWNDLVRRYQPLIWGVCRRHGLVGADADDIGGIVWLQLVSQLTAIREPAALPGWLATTTRRACLSQLRHQRRQISISDQEIAPAAQPPSDTELLTEERWIALRNATATMPDRDRQLLSLLFSETRLSYVEISARLGIPIGAIGPTRQRCLARIRQTLPSPHC